MTASEAGRELSRAERLVRSVGWQLAAWRVVLIGTLVAATILAMPWFPQEIWNSGSPVPLLLLLLGLVGACCAGFIIGLSTRESGRRRRSREIEVARGLGDGALSGALELGRADGVVSDLARLHRGRVAEALIGGSRRELLPAASTRVRGARMAALPVLGVVLAVAMAGLLKRPAEVGRTLGALATPWGISFPPPPPPLRLLLPDGEVLRGSSVRVTVLAEGRSRVDLVQQRAGLALHHETLPVTSGRAQAELGPVKEATRVWAESSEDVSDTVDVVPVDPLSVTDLNIETVFPEYLGRPAESVRGPLASLEVPVGTSLRITVRTNHPLVRFGIVREGPSGRDTLDLALESESAQGTMVISDSVLLSWILEPEGRVPGIRLPPPLSVTVVPDAPPSVGITYPGEDRVVGLERELPLLVEARDDHGLADVALVWWRESPGGRSAAESQRLAGAEGVRRIAVRPVLDLSLAGLLPGDELVYYATARDRRPGSQASVSGTFRVRITGIRELQRDVEQSTGSLADDARELRDRAGRLTDSAREAERRNGNTVQQPGSPPEQNRLDAGAAQDARSLLAESRSVQEEATEIRESLRAVREKLEGSPVQDPDLERRLGELEELYTEILESGLGERIEELEKALRDLRGEDVRGAMSNLSRQAAELEERLDRALGLLERVAAEQALEGSRQQAEDLASRQARSAGTAVRDSSWAERQGEMAAETDSLAGRVEQLAERLDDLDAPDAATGARRAAGEARAGAENMRSARREAGRSDSGGSSADQAGTAAEQMKRAESQLARAGESLSDGWRTEAMRAVAAATSEALELAREQQQVVERLRSGERPEDLSSSQTAIREGLDNLTQSLAEAGKQTALLDRRSGPAAAAAGREMDAVGQSLAAGASRREEGMRQGEAAMEALSDLAGSLMASGRAMSEASSATGMEEALERMAGASRRQAGVNSESGELFLLLQGGEPADGRLRELGGRQREISDELRRIAEDPALRELTGRPGELAEEADDLAREITAGSLNRETLARQERLFRRLLDAGRSLEQDEDDARRREATSPQPGAVFMPAGDAEVETGLRYPYPAEATLEGLTASQRRIVYDYFDRLNAGPNPEGP